MHIEQVACVVLLRGIWLPGMLVFRRYTRNASERKITECQFADDAALLASTRPAMERMVLEYQQLG